MVPHHRQRTLKTSVRTSIPLTLAVGLATAVPLPAQDQSVEERLDHLERENAKLRGQIDAVAGQLEEVEFRDIMPEIGESQFGMGPAASKVYAKDQGLSIGGYGEMAYTNKAGQSDRATVDFLRAIVYTGYKFDENWVFNSEFEVEHSVAGEGKNGEAAMEFAYLEYLHSPELNVRTGLLLMPMGIVNEMHEPTTFLGADRPETERRIIPSTWRENGLGILGGTGDFDYKLYAVNGMDGSKFTDSGLRSGRQKGSKAAAEDIAFVGRIDWAPTLDFTAGLSAYVGDSAQGDPTLGNVSTTIVDLHAQYQWRGLRLRGLFAQAEVDDTERIFASSGEVVGEEMRGWYVEAGYDLMDIWSPTGEASLTPFIRHETIDTHASVAATLTPDPSLDDNITTVGIDWQPIPNIVFKAGYADYDKGKDRATLSLGYVF